MGSYVLDFFKSLGKWLNDKVEFVISIIDLISNKFFDNLIIISILNIYK